MTIKLGNLYFEDFAFIEALQHLWSHRIVNDLKLKPILSNNLIKVKILIAYIVGKVNI